MHTHSSYFPDLGFGLGLRIPHYAHIFEHWPKVDWFEIISENFMDTDGKAKRNLARISERYQIVMHGIALSIGTVDPLNSEYLRKLKKLMDTVKPAWISDHLCWNGIAHKNTHDLLPVPYTEEALNHIISRIKQVQDYLERPIALENPSTYLEFTSSTIPEAEFIAIMAKESGCHLLLDVNNVYVTCYNHRLDAKAYIDALPLDKVAQIHLSGHSNYGSHIIDTHDDHVIDEVWSLYKYVIHKAGRMVNTMVEWDDKVPEWDVLYNELDKAKKAAADAQHYAPLPDLAREHPSYIPNITTTLSTSQSLMQEAILAGENYNNNSPDTWIRSKPEFPAKNQLAVYVNAYRYRLYEVTAEDYPILKHYLGACVFKEILWDFVNKIESTYFNIARYAAVFPDFIAQHPKADAIAHELAVLETVIAQLDAKKETLPLEPAHLQGITPESFMEIRLYPRAALQLLAFNYDIDSYYTAINEEKPCSSPEAQKTFLAVFRHEDIIWRMRLEQEEYYLLQKLFARTPVGEALEGLHSESNLSEELLIGNLSQWFSRWIRNGLLAYHEYNHVSDAA